jgi:PTS system mannose-specific IIA component
MSVALLLITHNDIGRALLNTATVMLDGCPLRAETMSVPLDSQRDQMEAEARTLVKRLDEGDGVLVLSDLFGSTPANVASALKEQQGCRVLTGINLPMLVRVLNYPALSLEELAEKALSGGREGVLLCNQRDMRTG